MKVLKVWVDADACPRSVMHFLKTNRAELGYDLVTISTTNHLLDVENHITVDPGPQAVDLAIANRVQQGDIVVTQEVGLQRLFWVKSTSHCAQRTGLHNRKIPFMLEQRNLLARYRRGGGRTKGPAARTGADNERFRWAFLRLLRTSR